MKKVVTDARWEQLEDQEEQLSRQLIEAQKIHSDLLKWKMIVVAALGAVGLGLSGSAGETSLVKPYLVLCCIPLVCAYIDLLARHLSLRILVIAKFLRKDREDPYQDFAQKAREKGAFLLESGTIVGSSILLSAALAFVELLPVDLPDEALVPVQFSGYIGLVLVILVEGAYRLLLWLIPNPDKATFNEAVKD